MLEIFLCLVKNVGWPVDFVDEKKYEEIGSEIIFVMSSP